jgi:hypothetical protein
MQIIYNDGKLKDSYFVTKEPPYGTAATTILDLLPDEETESIIFG